MSTEIDMIVATINELREEIRTVREIVDYMSGRLDDINFDLGLIKKDVASLEGDVSVAKWKISDLESNVVIIEGSRND